MRHAVLGLCLCFILTGCSLTPTALPSSEAGAAIRGIAHGGRQPISAGRIYLYTPGSSGYGLAATSLLNSSVLTNNPGLSGQDANGNYYVTTDANGNFSISGDYACTPGSVAYLYLAGGDAGGGANASVGLLAALGSCPAEGNFAATTPYVFMNEVSTVAAAYAMAGYATDATHVSSSGTALAVTGLQNAFANAANLASLSTGSALTATPAGNGVVPQTTINNLANILAACVNSTGSGSVMCTTLFSNAKSAGSSGITPVDTATAAINIAHNPAANIATLYGLVTGTPPFLPNLSAKPNDFTIGINFTGGGLSVPISIAVDGTGSVWVSDWNTLKATKLTSLGAVVTGSPFATISGASESMAIDAYNNVWFASHTTYGVAKLTSAGVPVSGSPFTGGGLGNSIGMAIDSSNNIWVPNWYGNTITRLTNSGAVISGSPITPGNLSSPQSIAIDASGNAWLPNFLNKTLTKLTSAGANISGSPFSGSMNNSLDIAIDSTGNAWIANSGNSTITKLTSAGAVATGSPFSGGGMSSPNGIAIDGSGNAWVANNGVSCISEFTAAGVAVTTATGFTGGAMNLPQKLAADGSGNLWVANTGGSNGHSVTELIGIATPVVTPLAANLIAPYSAPASRP
ncbi:MAG: hypothetical protein P4L10_14450 [Acidobacteriaceae bacterium]|nr:hypothetical protein [Acidobacteriaceae bacterium]